MRHGDSWCHRAALSSRHSMRHGDRNVQEIRMAASTGRESDKFMLRLPDGMRYRIRLAASKNNRSMNAEIVATLEEKYPSPKIMSPEEHIVDIDGRIREIKSKPYELISLEDQDNIEFLEALREVYLWRLQKKSVDSSTEAQNLTSRHGMVRGLFPGLKLARINQMIDEIVAEQCGLFPEAPTPTVVDVLNLIEEALDSSLYDPRHPDYDAEKHGLLMDARDTLAKRAKTEPDAPAVSKDAARRAALDEDYPDED